MVHKTLFFTLLFYTLSLQSQNYTPLLDQTNKWYVTTCYSGCITDSYYTDGDTLVNNQMHKILDGYHYISRTFLLREDVNEKKVYLTKISGNRKDEACTDDKEGVFHTLLTTKEIISLQHLS